MRPQMRTKPKISTCSWILKTSASRSRSFGLSGLLAYLVQLSKRERPDRPDLLQPCRPVKFMRTRMVFHSLPVKRGFPYPPFLQNSSLPPHQFMLEYLRFGWTRFPGSSVVEQPAVGTWVTRGGAPHIRRSSQLSHRCRQQTTEDGSLQSFNLQRWALPEM
jgi:hypothetical protein